MSNSATLHYDEVVIKCEHRTDLGWQEVMVFDQVIDTRFAGNNPDGEYRCLIERDGIRRVEHFRVVRHQLAAAL
jgi:hypothetical protein